MGTMNRQLNLPALQNIMRQFERENARMEQVPTPGSPVSECAAS